MTTSHFCDFFALGLPKECHKAGFILFYPYLQTPHQLFYPNFNNFITDILFNRRYKTILKYFEIYIFIVSTILGILYFM